MAEDTKAKVEGPKLAETCIYTDSYGAEYAAFVCGAPWINDNGETVGALAVFFGTEWRVVGAKHNADEGNNETYRAV